MRSGKSNRRRGHDFERTVVDILHAVGFRDACRNLEYQPGKAGHDVEYTDMHGKRVRVSCKYGSGVPLTIYGHAITNGLICSRHIQDECVMACHFTPGHGWLTTAIGDCDELWAKHPRWPILRVMGPASRLR